jgi:hypothetical protein
MLFLNFLKRYHCCFCFDSFNASVMLMFAAGLPKNAVSPLFLLLVAEGGLFQLVILQAFPIVKHEHVCHSCMPPHVTSCSGGDRESLTGSEVDIGQESAYSCKL